MRLVLGTQSGARLATLGVVAVVWIAGFSVYLAYRAPARTATARVTVADAPPPTRDSAPATRPISPRVPRSVARGHVAAHVTSAATRHGVSEHLVTAVISVESEFNPRAVSRRGAVGLMQLMPATAAILGVRDSFDPRENIDGGARYLRNLMDRFDRNLPLVLAAYNAGETAVLKYGGVPPFPETREFVARVLRLLGDRREEIELGGTRTAIVKLRTVAAARTDRAARTSDAASRDAIPDLVQEPPASRTDPPPLPPLVEAIASSAAPEASTRSTAAGRQPQRGLTGTLSRAIASLREGEEAGVMALPDHARGNQPQAP